METWEKLLEKAVNYIKSSPLGIYEVKPLWSLGGEVIKREGIKIPSDMLFHELNSSPYLPSSLFYNDSRLHSNH